MSVTATQDDAVEVLTNEVPDEPAAQAAEARKMYKWSSYLHVGEGAAECEHATDGACTDPAHFHAWCRLSNPLQHEDIRKKGQAAKARKIREYKDPESDASVTLDQELVQINDEVFMDQLIDELLAREFGDDYIQARDEVGDREEFEHIDQDREEFARLTAAEDEIPDDERSDEWKQLRKHVESHVDAVRTRLDELQKPRREELASRGPDALVQLVREKRVEEAANIAFLDVYNIWQWFVGTYKVRKHETLNKPYEQMWSEIGSALNPQPGQMVFEDRDVIAGLRETYNDLSVAQQRASAGN